MAGTGDDDSTGAGAGGRLSWRAILMGLGLALAVILIGLALYGLTPSPPKMVDPGAPPDGKERGVAEELLPGIRVAILDCYRLADGRELPANLRKLFYPHEDDAGRSEDEGGPARAVSRAPSPQVFLTALDRMVISLDQRLRWDRVRTREASDAAISSARLFQFVTIFLGSLTTIFVGLQALWTRVRPKPPGSANNDGVGGIGDPGPPVGGDDAGRQPGVHPRLTLMAILIIITSASSTALASYVGYLSPATEQAALQLKLAQLRSLHHNLANVVVRYYGPPLCPYSSAKVESLVSPIKRVEKPALPGTPQDNASVASDPIAAFGDSYWAAYEAVDKIAQDFQATYPIRPATTQSDSGAIKAP